MPIKALLFDVFGTVVDWRTVSRCPWFIRRRSRCCGSIPPECLMVAAHNYDLEAASACGLRCAFVARPQEFGPAGNSELAPTRKWDFVANDFNDLAQQLGC